MAITDSEQYDLLDQLAETFAARFRRGEPPELKEYTELQNGRLADAIRDLQQARDRLRPLLRANPDDRHRAILGSCLSNLGETLRDSNRPIEALASLQEAQGLMEALIDPTPWYLSTLACIYCKLSLLSEYAAPPETFSERAALADRAMDALRRAVMADNGLYTWMDQDKSLDPLRHRVDFQALTLDRGFPLDAFANSTVAERQPQASPSTPAPTAPTPGGR